MKKFLTTILLLAAAVVVVFGQNKAHDQRMQEIQSMKIAFMTDFLKLTPAESEKFWPVYNKYWDERMEQVRTRRVLYKQIESQAATQAQLEQLLKLYLEEAELIEKYAGEISRVLSVDKAAKVFVADEKFKSMLLRRSQGGKN